MKPSNLPLVASIFLANSIQSSTAFAPQKSHNNNNLLACQMSTRTQSFYNSDPSLSDQFKPQPQPQPQPNEQPSKLIALRDPQGIITGFTTDPTLGDFPIEPAGPGGQMTMGRPMSSYQTVNVPYDPNQMQQQMGGNMQQGNQNMNNMGMGMGMGMGQQQMMGGMWGYGMGYNDWYMPNTVQGYDEYGNTVITDRRFDVYGNVRNYGGWGGWGGWGMW